VPDVSTKSQSSKSESSCAEQLQGKDSRTHAELAAFSRILQKALRKYAVASDSEVASEEAFGHLRSSTGAYIKFNSDPTLAAYFKRLHE
jgi:hypothetical protein